MPIALCLLPIALQACAHGEPFEAVTTDYDTPLIPGAFPVRLTFNRGHDQEPSWLPDGSGLLYTAEQFRFDEGDWCLAVLPPTGGQIVRQLCSTGVPARDSVNAWHWASVGPGGEVVYARESARPNALAPRFHELVIAPWQDPANARVLVDLPRTLADGVVYGGLAQVRWLDAASLVLRADLRGYPGPCPQCPPDTVIVGRRLVLVRLSAQGPPQLDLIPDTEYATSVAARSADEIYYTQRGDSRVFRRILSTGDTSVVWDFGGPIARGVQVSGDRMVAVVGGIASFGFDPSFNDSTMRDGGGILHFVDLAANQAGVVDQFALYRYPALSPDGRRLVVENIARAPDLFLYLLP